MLGDSAAIETFSASFAAVEALKRGIVLAADPKIVSGFGVEVVEAVELVVTEAKLKTGFGFSDGPLVVDAVGKLKLVFGFSAGKFSLLPTVNVRDFSVSPCSVDAFIALLNEKFGLLTPAGSYWPISGAFSVIGFGAGLNVNEVCDCDLVTPNASGEEEAVVAAVGNGLIDTLHWDVGGVLMAAFED